MTYIPRSSIGNNGMPSQIPRAVQRKRTFKIFGFLGTVVLLVALLGTGGVFLFKSVSQGQLDNARTTLADTAGTVGDRDTRILELQMYDEQLKTASDLLDNHLALSRLLTALEASAKETIQYTSLDYVYDPGFDALLTLDGVSDEFVSVVLQDRQLNSVDSPFEVARITDITKSADAPDGQSVSSSEERVVFNVTGLLQSSALTYRATAPSIPEPQGIAPETPMDTESEENTGSEEGLGDNQESL